MIVVRGGKNVGILSVIESNRLAQSWCVCIVEFCKVLSQMKEFE